MTMKNVKAQSAKALANVSLKLGKVSVDSACCYIFHQPKHTSENTSISNN